MDIVPGNICRMRVTRWSYPPEGGEAVVIVRGELIFVTETPKLSPHGHGDYLVKVLRDSKILVFWADSKDIELVEA